MLWKKDVTEMDINSVKDSKSMTKLLEFVKHIRQELVYKEAEKIERIDEYIPERIQTLENDLQARRNARDNKITIMEYGREKEISVRALMHLCNVVTESTAGYEPTEKLSTVWQEVTKPKKVTEMNLYEYMENPESYNRPENQEFKTLNQQRDYVKLLDNVFERINNKLYGEFKTPEEEREAVKEVWLEKTAINLNPFNKTVETNRERSERLGEAKTITIIQNGKEMNISANKLKEMCLASKCPIIKNNAPEKNQMKHMDRDDR